MIMDVHASIGEDLSRYGLMLMMVQQEFGAQVTIFRHNSRASPDATVRPQRPCNDRGN